MYIRDTKTCHENVSRFCVWFYLTTWTQDARVSDGPKFPVNERKRLTHVSFRVNDEDIAKLDHAVELLSWRWHAELYAKQAQEVLRARKAGKPVKKRKSDPMKASYADVIRAAIDTLIEDLEARLAEARQHARRGPP